MYYYAGSQRVAMRTGTAAPKWILSDHLGSTSVVTDYYGANPVYQRYKPFGETRLTNPLGTKYTFTGQLSHTDDFGLLFFNARWVDPQLARFAQADTIVPNPSFPLSWDRYAYAYNNPIRYNDPSGHDPIPNPVPGCTRYDSDWNCVSGGIGNGTQSLVQIIQTAPTLYEYSLSQGREFVNGLMANQGWWSRYFTSYESLMQFLIALAYAFEMGSAWGNQTIHALIPQAFANKMWGFIDEYGIVGFYIFIGSMQTIRSRIDDAQSGRLLEPQYLGTPGGPGNGSTGAFAKTAGVWNGSLSSQSS